MIEKEDYVSPLKSIRKKCLDCCCDSSNEVKLCTVKTCPLYDYRFGKNPFRKKREVSEEFKEKARIRLQNYHKNKKEN